MLKKLVMTMQSLYKHVVPQFELTIVENIDGMLEVRWTFLHTGGQPLHFISVMCSGSSSRQLCNTSLCTLTSACGDGSTRLGPVEAGNSYTCTVTASNAVGDTASNTSTVKAFTGNKSVYFLRRTCYTLQ